MAFTPPDLSNATPEMLADEMGKLSVLENYVKKLRKFYREAFYARLDYKVDNFLNGQVEQFLGGETFVANTTRSDPTRINTEKLKLEYPDIAEACCETKGQLATRFQLKEGVTNPKVESLMQDMLKELDLE